MPNTYSVTVTEFATISETPDAWQAPDYRALLDAMDFEDTGNLGDGELREMCLMSLQDLEPEEAALIVLQHVIGEDRNEGQLRNMANEMRDEKLWEEYVEPSFHGRLFRVGSLLYSAVPGVFPKTDAVQIKLSVTSGDAAALNSLNDNPDPGLVLRILVGGMAENAVLRRLYEEQLAGTSFPNARDMIWEMTSLEDGSAVKLDILSSGYWLDPLERVEAYECVAHPDSLEDEAF